MRALTNHPNLAVLAQDASRSLGKTVAVQKRSREMSVMTREGLYQQVWARPMFKVAADLGVTGTGLKKICDRHVIPTPARGYWAKLAHGKRVNQSPLPTLANTGLGQIRIAGPGEVARPESVRLAKAEALEALKRAAPAPAAPETPSIRGAELAEHKILVATRKAMIKARTDAAGFILGQGRGVVGFKLGPGSIERAMAALNRMLGLAEAAGYSAQATDGGLALSVDGESVGFTLEEQPARTPHEPTAAELRQKAENQKHGYGSLTPWPIYDHHPSGRLALIIQANSYSRLRRTYGDRQGRRLEDLLTDAVAGFAEHAAFTKEQERIAHERARDYRRAEARRRREHAFEKREARREAFVEAVAEQLALRARLARVLAHLDADPDDTARYAPNLSAWVRERIGQIEALISPEFLAYSASSAMVDFNERRAGATSGGGYSYHDETPPLRFWSIDRTTGLARAQSPLELAIAAGHAPGIEDDADDPMAS